MEQEVVNHLVEYKMRERLVRRKRLNALLLMLDAREDQKRLDVDTKSGNITKAREYYEKQISRVSPLLEKLEQVTDSYLALMRDAQEMEQSVFFGKVPGIPE